MWGYISSNWFPLTICPLKILMHPLNMSYTQDTSLKILSRRSTCIFLGIHVGLHLKLLVPSNHMSAQDLGASSQHVLSSRHIIGSVPQDLIVRLGDGHMCHSVQFNHSDYVTVERRTTWYI